MKTCTKCQTPKSLEKFNKSKSMLDGHLNVCKPCQAIAQLEYRRTKKGLVSDIYSEQKRSSRRRGHKPPAYTVLELRQWFREQPSANKLYKAWKLSGYDKDLRPSVDRLDDSKSYSFDNIQLMTWGENKAKGYADVKSGKIKSRNKAVVQMDMDGNFIAEHHSAAEASRKTGTNRHRISDCCNNKIDSFNDFKWKFV